MANNRYYLYCPYCHESKWFAKSLGLTEWESPYEFYKNALYNDGRVSAEDVMIFITNHIACTPWRETGQAGRHHSPEWWDGTFIEIISEYDERLKLDE